MGAWNRFWHEFAVTPARVRALRVGLFGLLAFDIWMKMLEHAPRYGAGGFNVPQFPLLSFLPVPSAEIVGVAWLLAGFAALRAAFGVAVRQSAIIVAVAYAGIYMWSQADNYQHHYLVSLMLVTGCFVPWEAASRAPRDTAPEVRHWSFRMLYVQVALLYFWAAVAKMDPLWLSGSTMAHFTQGVEARANLTWLANGIGVELASMPKLMSWSVMLGELFAAAVFLVPRLRLVGLLVVPWFHISVEWLSFEIEWFSYYMILLNVVLLTPRRAYEWAGERLGWVRERVHGWIDRTDVDGKMVPTLGVATALVCALIVFDAPVEGALGLVVVVALATLAAQLVPDPGVRPHVTYGAAMQVLAAGAMMVTITVSAVAYDYYRQWGGDLRRRGETALAIDRYEKANALTAGPARFHQLGQLYASIGERAKALQAYEASLRRQRSALEFESAAAEREPTDATLHFDVGERQLRVAERCGTLAAAYRKLGREADAAAHERCRTQAGSAGAAAFTRGLRHAPRDARGHRGKRDAARYQ